MNDLRPPPRRPLPSPRRERIRDVLNSGSSSIDVPVRRSMTPWLAAATVAAIAVGGYGVATTIGGDGGSGAVIAPAAGTDSTTPRDRSASPEHSTRPEGTPAGPGGSVPPVPSIGPDEAYERCITQVRQTPQEPPFDDPRGRVVASAAGVMTVVVSNGT